MLMLVQEGYNLIIIDLYSFYNLRGRMTAKEGPSSFTLVSANISWRFNRLDLKSCFEVHLAMYEVGCYW
jgi:hypothetical protein